jgi:hypothetical protein
MGFLIGGLLVKMLLLLLLLLLLAGCLSVSLRTKTLREITENMGQCTSRERNFKE